MSAESVWWHARASGGSITFTRSDDASTVESDLGGLIEGGNEVTCIAAPPASPASPAVALCGTRRGTVAVWGLRGDASANGRMSFLGALRTHAHRVRRIVMGPGGTRAVTCSDDCTSVVLSVPELAARRGPPRHAGEVDGPRSEAHRRLVGHRATITDAAFTADATKVISGAADGTLLLHRICDGALLRRMSVGDFALRSLALSIDETVIFACSAKEVVAIDCAPQQRPAIERSCHVVTRSTLVPSTTEVEAAAASAVRTRRLLVASPVEGSSRPPFAAVAIAGEHGEHLVAFTAADQEARSDGSDDHAAAVWLTPMTTFAEGEWTTGVAAAPAVTVAAAVAAAAAGSRRCATRAVVPAVFEHIIAPPPPPNTGSEFVPPPLATLGWDSWFAPPLLRAPAPSALSDSAVLRGCVASRPMVVVGDAAEDDGGDGAQTAGKRSRDVAPDAAPSALEELLAKQRRLQAVCDELFVKLEAAKGAATTAAVRTA